MIEKIIEIYRYRNLLEHEIEFFKWLIGNEQARWIEQLERLNALAAESIGKKSDRIAELESKLAAAIELDEAKLQQVDSQAERIAELENQLAKAQNELIMESGERAAYQASNAELERTIEDMQNGAARYDARITMMEQKDRQNEEHMVRLHERIAEL